MKETAYFSVKGYNVIVNSGILVLFLVLFEMMGDSRIVSSLI